ncbi:MAG: dihydroorotase [Bdellovibrionales bacterium]|nr:dihydroorotase [Bdellovibrionales bacterium]
MILIHGGRVIDPANGVDGDFDILIEKNRIANIDRRGSFDAMEISDKIDASGKWVVPGFIDLHVHLREPGFEWKETIEAGSRAAIYGGFTSICAMPNTRPVNDTAQVTEYMLDRAKSASLAKVLPIGAVSLGSKGEQMAPLSELRKAGCVAFSDDGEPIFNAGLMRRALEWSMMLDAVVSCHEEDKSLTCGGCMNESGLSVKLGLKGMPTVGEDVMVARDIELARFTGGRVHFCHISTARSVELVRRAKNDGISVTCEVTPHHLTLTEEAVREYDTFAKMSPPLREAGDVEGLIAGLADGTIDAVASDHAPHEDDSKKVEFAQASFGILGLQTNLPLIIDLVRAEKISASRAVEVFTSGPARAFGLDVGTLSKGATADLSVIDPGCEWELERAAIASISKNTPFYGRKLFGRATDVVVDGVIKLRNSEI